MIGIAVLTISDRSFAGLREDATGPALATLVERSGHRVLLREVLSDDRQALADRLVGLVDVGIDGEAPAVILAAGGTGLGPRDTTPEALAQVAERTVPGVGELVRARSVGRLPQAALSRATAVTRAATLIVALPGSPDGACEGWRAIVDVVDHAAAQLAGSDHTTVSAPDRGQR